MPRVLRALLVVGATTAAVAAVSVPASAQLPAEAPRTRATASDATGGGSGTGPTPAADAAWAWVLGQRGTGTPVTAGATISPAQTYAASWTGPVSGTFAVAAGADVAPAPLLDTASLTVDTPTSVPADYLGMLHGHVRVTPAAGRWIVQVLRDTATGPVQVPLQTLVAPDGSFDVDLGAAHDVPAGTWALELLDATAGYAPSGTAWPAAVHDGWVVRAAVTTDATYPVAEQPARADGTFSFPSSAPGTKTFQLVDTRSGAVLAEAAPEFGLVRSTAGGSRTYTYDQALALVAAVDRDDPAATDLTSGLITLQRSGGGFVESADARNPAAADPVFRSGICAVATYALLRRVQAMSPTDPALDATRAAAESGVTWLLARRRTDGLVAAGQGDRQPDGTPAPDVDPAWVSTEHQLDTWQAWRLAATVLAGRSTGTAAAGAADVLSDAVVTELWDATTGRFDQGIAPDGSRDTTDPLDVSSWGAVFLHATGRTGLAAQALAHTAASASTDGGVSGYRAYRPQDAFPTAPADVWVEGTAGVALAQIRSGDATAGAATLAALEPLQDADGSLPGATTADAATGMTTDRSVAAAAWFVLASSAVAGDGSGIW